jgi:deoxyadenosine/deoxycytidine kinase
LLYGLPLKTMMDEIYLKLTTQVIILFIDIIIHLILPSFIIYIIVIIIVIIMTDRNRWSFTFQMCALLSRFKSIEGSVTQGGVSFGPSHSSTSVFVSERCLDTDYHCFTKMLHSDGAITGMELQIYEQYFSHLVAMSTPLSAIVHVNTKPDLCFERIKQRNRRGEDGISLEYLRSLDYWTNHWIKSTNVPVLSIDPSSDDKDKVFYEFIEKCIVDHHSLCK